MDKPNHVWDLYRSLLAVTREGSLSGAARRLGLTQPATLMHWNHRWVPPCSPDTGTA
ncbi:helix-turn-helix domain-containing protein [Saccharospirillum impatiens]|uniref:helix-turn-helix domain-containing protein n=1 Tax=Saccharospirillum impatiens TaxID=169438 RepID=UPI00042A228D|nr:LysR family transcriptional regulator [Saccharospirillum impatiens]